jgi:hypothetical protein
MGLNKSSNVVLDKLEYNTILVKCQFVSELQLYIRGLY